MSTSSPAGPVDGGRPWSPDRKPPHSALWWILLACAVLGGALATGAWLQYGPLPIEVRTSSDVLIDYEFPAGAMPINQTSYSLNVSICPTFHGWTGGTFTCEFTISNPMNLTQYEWGIGFLYGWTVPGKADLTTVGSNVTFEPNGTIALMPLTGLLRVSISATLPDEGGGEFTNHIAVGMVGWGCYNEVCSEKN